MSINASDIKKNVEHKHTSERTNLLKLAEAYNTIANNVINTAFFGWTNFTNANINNLKPLLNKFLKSIQFEIIETLAPEFDDILNMQKEKVGCHLYYILMKAAFLRETGVGDCDVQSSAVFLEALQLYFETKNPEFLPRYIECHEQITLPSRKKSKGPTIPQGPLCHAYVEVNHARDDIHLDTIKKENGITKNTRAIDTWMQKALAGYEIQHVNPIQQYHRNLNDFKKEYRDSRKYMTSSLDAMECEKYFHVIPSLIVKTQKRVRETLDHYFDTGRFHTLIAEFKPKINIELTLIRLFDFLYNFKDSQDRRIDVIRRLSKLCTSQYKNQEPNLELLSQTEPETMRLFLLLFFARQPYFFKEKKLECCLALLELEKLANELPQNNPHRNRLIANAQVLLGKLFKQDKNDALLTQLLAEQRLDTNTKKNLLEIKHQAIDKFNDSTGNRNKQNKGSEENNTPEMNTERSVNNSAVLHAGESKNTKEKEKTDETNTTSKSNALTGTSETEGTTDAKEKDEAFLSNAEPSTPMPSLIFSQKSGAAASLPANTTPKSYILNQNTTLMKLESRFLDLRSISRQAQTCGTFSEVFKDLLEQAKMAAPLLNLVLNIDEKGKKEILEIIKANPKFILYRSQGRVNYFSSKQNKIVARILISNLSPLEAAALSGDFHLVNIFRDALTLDQKQIAGLQLDEILSRPDFLSAFHALQKAYHEYLKQYIDLMQTDEAQKKITSLWEHIGEAQKNLSLYGLQVFCNPIRHKPLPDLTKEPARVCKLYDDRSLDLDSIGLGTECALWKAERTWGQMSQWGLVISYGVASVVAGRHRTRSDSEAIDLLCKVIPDELGKTKALLLQYKPEASNKQESVSTASTVPALDSDKEQGKNTLAALSLRKKVS